MNEHLTSAPSKPSSGIALSLAGLVLAAVLPLLVFGIGVAHNMVQQKQAGVADRLAGNARGLQVAVDRVLSSQLAAMEVLATDVSLDGGRIGAFQDRARRVVQGHADWRNVVLIDPATHLIVASVLPLPTPAPTTSSPADVDEVARSRTPRIAGVYAAGRLVNKPIVLLLVPVIRAEAVRYVLAVVMDPATLSRVFVEQQVPASWTGAIVDDRMALAGRSREAELLVGERVPTGLADHITAGHGGMFTSTTFDGELVYTVFSRSPTTGWTVALGIPAAEVEGPINQTLARMVTSGAVLVLLALLVTAGVGRKIVARRQAYEQALQDELEHRRQVEAELRASQQRLSDFSTSSADWFWESDADQRFCFLSDNFDPVVGLPKEAVLHHTRVDLLSANGLNPVETVKAHAEQLQRCQPIRGFEYRLRDANGEVRWLAISGVPRFDAQGGFIGYRGVGQDVTARRRAEEAAEQGHRLLREAVDNVASGFTIYDADDRLVICNRAYLDIYGTSRDLIVPGARFEDIVRQGALRGQYQQAQGRVEEWVAERVRRHQNPTGHSIEQELNDGRWLLIVETRTPTGYIVGNRIDITDRKKAEAEVHRHRHQLEELVASRTAQLVEALDAARAASLAKSQFLANMSHEIRTPLNAISGLVHLIQRSGVNAEHAARLAKIEAANRHLLEIITAILDLSKIEAGKLVLNDGDVDLEAVVGTVVALASVETAAKHIELTTDIEPVPWHLRGDGTRLHQALLNYVANAVKFTERGHIGISVRCDDDRPDSVLLRFEVRDTGIGIAAPQQSGLFEAFQQADNSATRQHGGTGLGLAITKRFAELMGGSAGLTSRLGLGSTFWFTARLKKAGVGAALAPPPDMQARPEPGIDFSGRRVLLAEDNPVNVEVMVDLLTDLGLTVDVANDGVEAVAMAGLARYDLMLMDMQMPRMGGMQATRLIRRLPACATVPVLAVTANAFVEDRALCLQAGMNDFITKPIEPGKLAAILQAWLAPSPAAPR